MGRAGGHRRAGAPTFLPRRSPKLLLSRSRPNAGAGVRPGLGLQILARWHPAARDAFRVKACGSSKASAPSAAATSRTGK